MLSETSSISAIIQFLEYSDPVYNVTQCILWNSSNFHSLNPPQKEVIERMVDFIQFWSVQKTQLVQHAPRSIFNIWFWNLYTSNYSLYSFQWKWSHYIWSLYEKFMTVLPRTPIFLTSFRTGHKHLEHITKRLHPPLKSGLLLLLLPSEIWLV